MQLLDLPPECDFMRRQHVFADDFNEYVSGDRWTLTATDSGTALLKDERNGVLELTASDGTVADNDEIYLASTKEIFLFTNDKPIIVEARLSFAEAATNAANVMFGLIDLVAANTLQDNGAGPDASYSGALFFKEDGQTLWTVENSIAGTQKTTQLSSDYSLTKENETAGMSGYQVLRIEIVPTSTTKHDVRFWRDNGDGMQLVRVHKDQVYTSATEMQLAFGLKNGSGTVETMKIDYAFGVAKR